MKRIFSPRVKKNRIFCSVMGIHASLRTLLEILRAFSFSTGAKYRTQPTVPNAPHDVIAGRNPGTLYEPSSTPLIARDMGDMKQGRRRLYEQVSDWVLHLDWPWACRGRIVGHYPSRGVLLVLLYGVLRTL